MEPISLNLAEILEIHRDQIDRYGGRPGVRDLGLLQSALAMPQSGAAGRYFHEFPHGMAAAYLFHLASNHALIDGNKRVAAVAARVFLLMNDCSFDPPEEEYESLTLAVASGQTGKAGVIEFFRKHLRS